MALWIEHYSNWFFDHSGSGHFYFLYGIEYPLTFDECCVQIIKYTYNQSL